MSRYKAVLHEWAAQHVPPQAKITDVSVQYDAGFSTECTTEDPDVTIVIRYELDGTTRWHHTSPGPVEVCQSLGSLLTSLLLIEDTP